MNSLSKTTIHVWYRRFPKNFLLTGALQSITPDNDILIVFIIKDITY